MLRAMRGLRRLGATFGGIAVFCACGGAPATHAPRPQSAPAMSAGAATAAPARRPAALATFADLLQEAGARMAAGADAAAAPCLLAVRDSGYELPAELMPALSELARPADDLDAQLRVARGPVRALTAWGQAGAMEPDLAVAAFTALPPQSLRAGVVALALTDEGAYLRYGAGAASDADGPLPIAAVVPRLLARSEAAQAVLYVTAESATPLSQLAELLRLLPHGRAVALAQLMPLGTQLPPLAAAAPPARACPDGLPEPAKGRAEGELPTEAVVAALAPLRESASGCLVNAQGAARAGGRIAIALRVDEQGAIEDACLLEDGIADAALAACVLASARVLRLPAPQPPGFVDVHLPLALTPSNEPAPAPLCE